MSGKLTPAATKFEQVVWPSGVRACRGQPFDDFPPKWYVHSDLLRAGDSIFDTLEEACLAVESRGLTGGGPAQIRRCFLCEDGNDMTYICDDC